MNNNPKPATSGSDLCTLDENQTETVVDKLTKIGCLNEHYKVQDCFFEKKDWRKCQVEVKEFKACLDRNKKSK